MAESERRYLKVQPGHLHLGTTFVGATVRGSFLVPEATSCRRAYGLEPDCDASGRLARPGPLPDWLTLDGPTHRDRPGLVWRFVVRTDRPGPLFASLAFDCDAGVGRVQVRLDVADGAPRRGDVVLCGSPFYWGESSESIDSLVRILDALSVRVHCLDGLADLGPVRPRAVLLDGLGLLQGDDGDVAAVERLAAGGTTVVVLADEFFCGTTAAANRVLAPFGLQMKRRGADEPGLDREERVRRIQDWGARYDRAPIESGPAEVRPHRLTAGVRRVHWFRPCPVVCTGPASRPLVCSPGADGESFAAVSEQAGCVVAVGKSLWSGLAGVGWPYDNDRLLANLLAGGDAEAGVA